MWLMVGIAAAFGVYLMLNKKHEELATAIDEKLPDVPSAPDGNYSKEIAIAASSTAPFGYDVKQWAALISGILSRESAFGETLSPKGPAGVGDVGNRWRPGPPQWAIDNGLVTGRSKLRSDGTTVFEISPPAAGGSLVPGWGYGLGQHDWEMGGVRDWIESGAWKDPQQNIMKTATKLAANYRVAKNQLEPVAPGDVPSINYAIAMYNAGAGVLADDDPDMRTTPPPYSADVLRRAAKYV